MWVWIAAGLGAWVALSLVIALLLERIAAAVSEFWLNWERAHPTETAALERGVPERPTARARKERSESIRHPRS
jgi:hypothetical protein